jgi:predicted ATPase
VTNLPAQQTRFIGRLGELGVAGELLRAHRLLTLVGAGGSGKTRLALQIAAEATERFPDGVFWVPLASVREPQLVEQTIARSVGAERDLGEYLADKTTLLVLDNVEQVIGEASALLASLLAACPDVRMLVTSREPLRITAEQRFVVDPLSADDAVALFVDRARAVDPTFVEAAAVEAICSRVDCLPLAVELAATWVSVLTLSALLERLEHRLPLLTRGTHDMPERHRTLRATIEWSEGLLLPAERRLFQRLAIFPSSFDLGAAEEVCSADLATLSSLVDKSLLQRARDGRFGLLETVRELADEGLTADERADLAARHAAYFTAAAEAMAGAQSWPSNPETFGELDGNLAHLRTALAWTQSTRHREFSLRLGIALSRYWIDRGHRHDACDWLETAPLDDESVSAWLRAAALEAAGLLDYFVMTDPDQAERYYMQSLTLHRELGNTQRVAFLLNRLGRIASQREDLEGAISLHRNALDLFEEAADNAGRAATLHLLAGVARDQGRHEESEGLFADAIRLARTSFPGLVRHSLHSLGDLALDRGDYRGAVAHYQASLDLTGASERRSRILCAAGIGSALAGAGDYPLSARVWGSVEAEERALGFRMLADERRRYERWTAVTRGQLGDSRFLAICADAASLPIDEALSQASGHLASPSTRTRNPAAGTADARPLSSDDARFEREGEYWSISFATRTLRLRDSKGLRVLAHLLADPARPHAALDLERLGTPGGEDTARAVASSDSGELLDAEARRAYRARVAELREAIETAEARGSANEVGLLREEMAFITHELSRALGLGGRSRHAGSIAERARLNVMRAVRSAMQRIAAADAELGAHLEATVHTGTVCAYTPDPRVEIAWRVAVGSELHG